MKPIPLHPREIALTWLLAVIACALTSCGVIEGLNQTSPHRAMTPAELDAYMKNLPAPSKP